MDSDTDQHGLRFSEEQYHNSGGFSNEEGGFFSDESRGETFTFGLDESTNCLRYKGKKYEDLQFSDMNGIFFRSVEDVERFYAYHSIAKGFSVRKSKSDKDRGGQIFRRSLCCSKEGWRKVQNPKKRTKVVGSVSSQGKNKEQPGIKRMVTRCGCPARLTVLRCNKTGSFYVSQFDTDHNHALVQKEMVHFLRSNRMVGKHASAQVSSLKKFPFLLAALTNC
ncbi:putative protein FAR1-RELATED SEQUENCE 10 [Rosa rugosa]|uniref:putative protein FAR1-RELATED SEQUENCE 10 n=1 Tax=Rosa rugosa TaxID=74645 RepID=UPI002B412CCD|nr:putative protein FAR1-RELATED SEQUENCE 10 [Rosa rugosa]